MSETAYYGIAFIVTVAVSLTLAAVAWRRRSVPGGTYFALMMLSGGWWALTWAIDAFSKDESLKIVCGQVSYIGMSAMPVFFMLFALSYWRPDIRIRLRYQILIWLMPVATIIIAATNGLHFLLWNDFTCMPSSSDCEVLIFGHGPWFYVAVAYFYLTVWVGVVLLFRAATSLSRIYRRQALIVLVASILPWIANVFFVVGFTPASGMDMAPIMASVTGLLLAFGIVKFQLFKVLPIAKEVVYKQIENGVLVVNSGGIVVDINPAAENMLGGNAGAGQKLDDVLKGRLGLSFPLPAEHRRTEVCLSDRDKPIWLDMAIAPLRDRHNQLSGHLIMLHDISDRKVAEEALRHSEERYRLLAENATDLIWASNINMKLTYISPSVSRLVGYTVEEAMALPMGKVYTPASAKAVIDVLKEEIEKERIGLGDPKRSRTVQAELYRKDGSIVPVEIIFSIVHDAEGKNVGTLAIARDITERKKVEEALRESEAKYRSLTENMNDVVWIMGLDLRITYVSPSVFKVLGFTPEEHMKRQIQDQLTPESLRFVIETWTSELERDEKQGVDPDRAMALELEYYRKDGSTVWMENLVGAIRDEQGKAVCLHGVSRDITERKKAEEASHRLAVIVESSHDAILSKTLDGIITSWNKGAEERYGYTAEETIGRHISILVPPDRVNETMQLLEKVSRGEAVIDYETVRVKKDGHPVTMLLTISPIRDTSGNVVGASSIAQDITERKHAEDRVRQVAEEWQTTFDSISDMVSIQDRDYKILRLNKAYADAVGMKVEDVIGKYCHDVVHNAASHIINCPHHRTIETKKPMTEEIFEPRLAAYLEVSTSPIFDKSGEVIGSVHIAKNINERKRTERLIRIRLSLLEYAATHSLEELLQKTLDEVGDLTDSPIGFYHFVEKDQKTLSLQAWSTRTIKEFCKAEGRGMHYGIDKAGVWVDCVRQRRPVIHNDYNSLPHKKGLPEGHAPVIRELVVPIMRGGEVVAVLGIGNKPTDYNDMDIEAVSYLADVAWEITRRKQAETVVAEERRRLSDILRGTNVGTWEWNVQTGETVFNERWAEIIGYTLDELSPVNIETWVKFGHPDDLKKSGELLDKHFKGELDYYECEARMRHKDGRWVWVLDRGRVHAWTDDGKPLWMSGTHQDITERKHIEEVLSASEEKLRLTFESIADGIVIIDLAGNVVDVNEATVRISGYRNKSQIIGRDAFDLLAPTDRRLALEDLKERVEGRPKERVEYSICPKDGRSFEAELTASTLRDENGSPIGYIAVIRDITERKLAEEALRQSEQKFKDLAEQLPQTIVEVDTEGRFTYVNHYGFESTGYTEEDVEKGIQAIDMFVPEQRVMAAENIGRILAGEQLEGHEYKLLRKDGTVYTALIYTNTVMRDGRPVGVRAIVVDISERKKIEQMKTDFVAFISHQLRTPTAGLMGYIDNMLDGITGELNSKQTEYLGEMRDVCARNNRLIADLLNISRLERGVLVTQINPVVLREAVDTAVKEHRKSIGNKGLALNVVETDRDIVVLADSDKLIEVLKNLIHNAFKFTKEGSIDVEISSRGNDGVVRIMDSGVGMSEEVVKDLFKKEKVFGGAVAVGGGAGLGLYIAKGFMKLQGGDIIVESAAGKGSTFTVSIPKK